MRRFSMRREFGKRERINKNCRRKHGCINCAYRYKCIEKVNNRNKKIRTVFLVILAVLLVTIVALACKTLQITEQTSTHGTVPSEVNITVNYYEENISVLILENEFDSEILSSPEVPELLTEVQPMVVEEQLPIISAYGPGEVYVYIFSEEEMVEITKEVYAEAGNQPLEGMVAVAAVICNRWISDLRIFDYATIHELLTAKNQFADISWVTQELLDKNPKCREAVEYACRGWDPTRVKFENGALYFYNPKYCSEEALEAREGIEVLIIGDHYFHETL